MIKPVTIQQADTYAARLLMISFFLPMIAQSISTVLLCVYFAGRVFTGRVKVPPANYAWALFLGGSYLLYLFSMPLTGHEYRAFLLILAQRSVSLILMPFVFAIIAVPYKELLLREMIWFVYASLIACVVGDIGFVYLHLTSKEAFTTLSHVEYRYFFEKASGHHPTYMSMYLCFSICILLFTGPYYKNRLLKYILFYLLLIFLFALLAKAPLIALVLILLHYAYLRRSALYKHKLLIAGMALCVAVSCYAIPFARQRIGEVTQFLSSRNAGNSAENSFYDRKMILNTDLDMLRRYWSTGVGPGRMLRMLHERYFFHSISRQSPVGYFDPHNEYFSQWLSFGIIGILLFLAILVAHFIRAVSSRNYLYLYLLILLSITFFTETVLSRQQGLLFYAILTSFFFFMKPGRQQSNDTTATPLL